MEYSVYEYLHDLDETSEDIDFYQVESIRKEDCPVM